MAEWYEEEEPPETPEDRNGPKALRAALKKTSEELAKLKTENSELQVQIRKSSIGAFFRDNGINPKLAKYVPADVDPTEDNLKKWVEEDGELFNIKLTPPGEKTAETSASEAGTPGTPAAPTGATEGVAAGWNAINSTTAGAMTPGKEADLLAQILAADSVDKISEIVFSHGGGNF